MKDEKKEKHPLLVQEEKLTKLQKEICGHYNATNPVWREVTQEIELLRHKVIMDSIRATVQILDRQMQNIIKTIETPKMYDNEIS